MSEKEGILRIAIAVGCTQSWHSYSSICSAWTSILGVEGSCPVRWPSRRNRPCRPTPFSRCRGSFRGLNGGRPMPTTQRHFGGRTSCVSLLFWRSSPRLRHRS
jgi:hypothetical protein